MCIYGKASIYPMIGAQKSIFLNCDIMIKLYFLHVLFILTPLICLYLAIYLGFMIMVHILEDTNQSAPIASPLITFDHQPTSKDAIVKQNGTTFSGIYNIYFSDVLTLMLLVYIPGRWRYDMCPGMTQWPQAPFPTCWTVMNSDRK